MSFLYIPVSRGSNGSNTFVGVGALVSLTTGINNSAFGYYALGSDTTGGGNVAVGYQAVLRNETGDFNIGVGWTAVGRNVSGSRNIGVGTDALYNITASSKNLGVGHESGKAITAGDSNAIFGSFQGNLHGIDIRTASNNIVLSDGDGNPRYAYLSATNEHLWKAGGAGATVGRLLQSITGASTDALLDITGTWNTTGAANGIRLNVTDTASAAGALLMDLRVGGVSRINIEKDGTINIPRTVTSAGLRIGQLQLLGNSSSNFGIFRVVNDALTIEGGAGQNTIKFISFAQVGWDSGAGVLDTALVRDAADTLAQRRGVNAQAFRIYNTFTDASNYERGFVRWSSNILQIGTEAGGTGANRDIQFWGYGRRIMTLTDSATVAAHIVGQSITTTPTPNGTLSVATQTNGVSRVGLDLAWTDGAGNRQGGFRFSDTQNGGDWVALQIEMIQSYGDGNRIVSKLAVQDVTWPGTIFVSETSSSGALTTSPTFQWRNSSTVQLTIDANNNIVANNAAVATNATNGFFYVAGCAGTPTGTPTAYTGRVPIVVDTTNNKLYFYSGGAWRDAGP